MEYIYNKQIGAFNVSFTQDGKDYTAIYDCVEENVTDELVQSQIDAHFSGEESGLTSVVEVVIPVDPPEQTAEEIAESERQQSMRDECQTLTDDMYMFKVEKDKLSKEMVELGEYILAMKQMEADFELDSSGDVLYKANKVEYERLAGLFNIEITSYKSKVVEIEVFKEENSDIEFLM